ncbi:MAG: cyclic nucleotide-binding domain-containing protein [bacterium]|nr:cyclic nucleotide-binding domain-containing protein [bacterium]
MLTTVERVIFLQDVDVFAKIPLEDLAYVAMIADEVVAEPGRVLYAEGDISDSMYLVLDGSISLQRGGIEVMLAGPRDVFGTWALFDDETRIVTAVAAEESNLLRIDKEDFLDLLADHSIITEGVLKVLASKLRNLVG